MERRNIIVNIAFDMTDLFPIPSSEKGGRNFDFRVVSFTINLFPVTNFKKIKECLISGTNLGLKDKKY